MKLIYSRRSVSSGVIERLDNILVPGTNDNTHTHLNKALLDQLNLDADNRLHIGTSLLQIPLSQEDW
jgi:hypothetical protein